MAPKRVRWAPEEENVYIPPSPERSPYSLAGSPLPKTPDNLTIEANNSQVLHNAVNAPLKDPVPSLNLAVQGIRNDRSNSPSTFSATVAGSSGLLPLAASKETSPLLLHPLLALETHSSKYYWNVTEDPSHSTVLNLNGRPVPEDEMNSPATSPPITRLDIHCVDVEFWKPLPMRLGLDNMGRLVVTYPGLTSRSSPHHSPSGSTDINLPANRSSPPSKRTNTGSGGCSPTTATTVSVVTPSIGQGIPIPIGRRMSTSSRGSFSSLTRPNLGFLKGVSPVSSSSASPSPRSSSSATTPVRSRTTSLASVPPGFTVSEVLYGIYIYLQRPMREQEFQQFDRAIQSRISENFYRRCGYPQIPLEEVKQTAPYKNGLKRLDCLLGNTRFRCVLWAHTEGEGEKLTYVLKLQLMEDDGGPIQV